MRESGKALHQHSCLASLRGASSQHQAVTNMKSTVFTISVGGLPTFPKALKCDLFAWNCVLGDGDIRFLVCLAPAAPSDVNGAGAVCVCGGGGSALWKVRLLFRAGAMAQWWLSLASREMGAQKTPRV